MERKIGEIFEYNGEWYQCVEAPLDEHSCNGCYGCKINGGECDGNARNDGKFVIFKKLKKVGEPYEFDGHLFQSYRTFKVPIFTENYATIRELGNNSKISIEIKQNKEDVEEKKLNLREFDLEAAKAGKPVCTRDGRKARIICFDRDWGMHIVALVADPVGETVYYYLSNGKVGFDKQSDDDLMMLPEKYEGWINLYKDKDINTIFTKNDSVYSSRETAIEAAKNFKNHYVTTIKIEYEI